MKTLEHTRESDFKTIEVNISDEFFEVAEEIYDLTNKELPIMVSEDGKSIKIRYEKERKIGEKDTHAYLIEIKKIDFE